MDTCQVSPAEAKKKKVYRKKSLQNRTTTKPGEFYSEGNRVVNMGCTEMWREWSIFKGLICNSFLNDRRLSKLLLFEWFVK